MPRLLSQVRGNLVGGAWKFTAKKDRARIEIGSTRPRPGDFFALRNSDAVQMR